MKPANSSLGWLREESATVDNNMLDRHFQKFKSKKRAFENVIIVKDRKANGARKPKFTCREERDTYYINLVKERLQKGVYTKEIIHSIRSKLWNVFGLIRRDDRSVLEGWLWCLKCEGILLFDGRHYYQVKSHPCYARFEESLKDGSDSDVSSNNDAASAATSSTSNRKSLRQRRRKISGQASTSAYVDAEVSKVQDSSNQYEFSGECLETSSALLGCNINQMEVDSLCSSETASRCAETVCLTNNISNAHKQEAICVCANLIVKDCLPTNIMATKSFEKLSALLIKMGAIYGEHLDPCCLIPSPGTITQAIREAAIPKKKVLKRTVQQVFESGAAAVSLYCWQDDYVKKHFVSAILHFEQNHALFAVSIGIKSLNLCNYNKANLQHKIENIFAQYNVTNFDNIVFVVHSEKVLNAALEGKTVLKCSCEMLTAVIDAAIDATESLTEIIQYCKDLIKQLKEDNLQKLLCNFIRNKHSTTGWLTCHAMFKAIIENWPKLQKIFAESPEYCLGIDMQLLSAVTEFLENCELVYEKLHCHTSPSLCFVILSINKIKEICKNASTKENIEPLALTELKRHILENLQKMWTNKITIYHKAACFLFPPSISMQHVTTMEEVKRFCAKQMKDKKLLEPNEVIVSIPTQNLMNTTPPHKIQSATARPKLNKKAMHFFFPNLGTAKEEAETAEEEVERYAEESIRIDDDFDAVVWWKNNLRNFPRLSKLALHMLTIPASCSASERSCKLVGNMNTDKTNIFDSKPFEDILLLNMTDQDVCDFISK